MMISKNQLDVLLSQGGAVVGEDGNKIGKIGQVYLNDTTGDAEWVTVHTGMFGGVSFVPLEHAVAHGEDITVRYSKEQVKDAPRFDDADGSLRPDQEADLYRHYELTNPRSATPSDTHADTPAQSSAPDTEPDGQMIRSEERLHVGTEQHQAGAARLRKHIVTEEETVTVPVSHEELQVSHEPMTDADERNMPSSGELSEEDRVVTLMADHVVTEKETVPVERIRLDTETVTEQTDVTEQIRKEQVDIEGSPADGSTTGRSSNTPDTSDSETSR